LTRDAGKTREKLLDTAIELVWQSNYDNVGVNEICSRAGVTKGAFYHHFESKADLYLAASRHYWEALKKELDAVYSPSFGPLENLENLIQFAISRQKEKVLARLAAVDACGSSDVGGCPFFTCGGQVGVGEEKVRQASVEMAENGLRYFVALVRGLKADGALEGDPDPVQTGRMLFQYMQGLHIYARVMNDRETVESDLRAGFYRLLDLKREHWRMAVKTAESAAAD
jgi:TetR/AcrR family transcriptional regulator, transcriptional repressor for nem operon